MRPEFTTSTAAILPLPVHSIPWLSLSRTMISGPDRRQRYQVRPTLTTATIKLVIATTLATRSTCGPPLPRPTPPFLDHAPYPEHKPACKPCLSLALEAAGNLTFGR